MGRALNEQLSPLFYLVVLLTAIITFAGRQSLRQAVLLVASLAAGAIFYPLWLMVLTLFSVLVVFPLARLFATRKFSAAWLWLAVLAAAGALFAARSDQFGIFWEHVTQHQHVNWSANPAALIGTSYFALRAMSLWFDAAHGKAGAITFPGVLAYLLFFPTFVSGPIDRYARFSAEVETPTPVDADAVDDALWRGVLGLFKKVVLADTLVALCLPAGNAFLPRLHSLTQGQAWVAFYAYAARIYLDFSGYSDVAIAVALLLGVRVPENFRSPYLARNITDFWKRWHISLSEWLRDYIFLPAGINLSRGIFKGQSLKAGCCAALLAFALCGLWHGLALNFLIWGLMHGVWVFAHKAYSDTGRQKFPAWLTWSRQNLAGQTLAVLLTFHGVAFTWIWFNAPDVEAALGMMRKMVGV
jgi:alginate O-acetyltransferase complex protein AlgI